MASAVLKFLQQHNRPFSFNEIQSGIKGTNTTKAAIQKGLEELVAKGDVVEKVNGKQKVYFLKQKTDSTTNELKEKLLEIDRTIHEINDNLKDVDKQIKEKSKIASINEGKMSLNDAIDLNVKLDGEIEMVNKKLEKYKDVTFTDCKRRETVEKDYDKMLKEYRKRKRICMDILNAIRENYTKTKEHLYEDIGIETDEDAGFSPDL